MPSPYFSEGELGPRPRTSEELSQVVWGAIVALIWSRLADGSFGNFYGTECNDGGAIYRVDEQAFSLALRGAVPEIQWPLTPDAVPSPLAMFDLIQFCYQSVAKPIIRSVHTYFGHSHFDFDTVEGRAIFRDDVNRLFSRHGIAYELTAEGSIVRIGPPLLREALLGFTFSTGDGELDRMLEAARKKLLDPDLSVRNDALETLWDAWERIKTLEIPGKGNKPASAAQLLDKASSEPNFRKLLEEETRKLTEIGNTFRIRHTEAYNTPIERSEHVDFLFHRLFAMIRLVLRMSGRGG
jgi:hypothetical protein